MKRTNSPFEPFAMFTRILATVFPLRMSAAASIAEVRRATASFHSPSLLFQSSFRFCERLLFGGWCVFGGGGFAAVGLSFRPTLLPAPLPCPHPARVDPACRGA